MLWFLALACNPCVEWETIKVHVYAHTETDLVPIYGPNGTHFVPMSRFVPEHDEMQEVCVRRKKDKW